MSDFFRISFRGNYYKMKIVIKMYKGVCFFILAMLESYEYIFRKMVMCEEKKIILKGYFMHKIRTSL